MVKLPDDLRTQSRSAASAKDWVIIVRLCVSVCVCSFLTAGDEGEAPAALWDRPPGLQPRPPPCRHHPDPAAGQPPAGTPTRPQPHNAPLWTAVTTHTFSIGFLSICQSTYCDTVLGRINCNDSLRLRRLYMKEHTTEVFT